MAFGEIFSGLKQTLGLGQVDFLPGDWTQALTGRSAVNTYGVPTISPAAGTYTTPQYNTQQSQKATARLGDSTYPTYPTTQTQNISTGEVLGTNTGIQNTQSAAEQAAQDAYNAENQSLNTQFDYLGAQIGNQLGPLGTQRDTSIAGVEQGLGHVRTGVEKSKTNLQTNTQSQINQAGDTARNVQGQNRNVLRALGILNSSAAGAALNKPMNEFDKQRASLGQFLVQKSTELDDFVTQKVSEAETAKQAIVSNYNNLVNQIQTDLRFNERQRNDALKTANAALSERLSQISQAMLNYQQQAEAQKQNFAAQMAAALNYQNPSYNQQALLGTAMTTPGQQTQTASIYDPNKRLGAM